MYKVFLWMLAMLFSTVAFIIVMSFAALEFSHPFGHPVGRAIFALLALGMALKIANHDDEVGSGV